MDQVRDRKRYTRTGVSLALLLLLLPALMAGCGYSFKPGQVREGLDTVAVAYFENNSTEPNVEVQLTEIIIQGLIADRTLRIAGEEVADAILYGTIRRYTFREAFFGADRQAEEYRIDIEVEVQMIDRRSGETVIEPQRIQGTGSYYLEDGAEGEEDARRQAATMIVQGIMNLVVEEW
ncbi:hypothetical protein DRQ53_05115 [bacterium]|nr:MAG: hypothetical protein DRQ32_02150 [bacterium]RKZ16863.1 MAG: hypothetical protein DRQ53_05115 [bacterium]